MADNEGQSEYFYMDGYGDAEYTIKEFGVSVAQQRLADNKDKAFSWFAYREGYDQYIRDAVGAQLWPLILCLTTL